MRPGERSPGRFLDYAMRIARNEIGISAFGESRPLVPTADGVREPQNRRVEIVLR